MASIAMVSLNPKASWDTHQRLSYTPHRSKPKTLEKPTTQSSPTVTLTTSPALNFSTPSELLKRSCPTPKRVLVSETSYMGYDLWLPKPPKVEKPRSVYNAASLAYIGDCIYELYARRHFLFPPLNIEEYNDRVMAVVRCEAQDALLQMLVDGDYLSKEERDVLRWGKNISSAKTRTKKRAGVAVYNRASSLETLLGYLYLTNATRLEEVMLKLGFSAGDSSTQLISDEESSGQTR